MAGNVLLVAQEPNSTTRLWLTKASLSKRYDVHVLQPKFTKRFSPRVISAALRYGSYVFQELLSSSDILHVFNSPDFIHLPSLVKGGKVVYDYRSNYSDKLKLSYPYMSRSAAKVEEMLAKRADIVLTVNDILASRLMRRTHKAIHVVPNYPSREFLVNREPNEVRASYDFSGSGLIVFIGNLTDTYDFDLLLASAKKLHGLEFWIVGSGKREAQLKAKSPSNVKFLGKVPHERVPDFIGAADVCVAPLRAYQRDIVHNDQDVWKITEYAAFRKPIVATNLAPSGQYKLVKSDVGEFSEAIWRACLGEVKPAEPRFWEDISESALLRAYEDLK